MTILAALAAFLFFLPLPAFAHDAATLDRMPSPHGGQVRMAGPFHLELVLEPERLTVHVMDHANQSFPIEDGRAKAVFSVPGEDARTVELLPIAEAALGRKGEFPYVEGMKVDVTVSLPGQKDWTATFTPPAPAGS